MNPVFWIAVLAGWVGSVTGMGSGVVLLPVLTYLGVDIKSAIAVSNISLVVISNGAVSIHLRHHMPNLKATAFLEVFAVLGALAGASIALASGRRLLFILCGALLLVSCFILWRRGERPSRSSAPQDPLSRWIGLKGSYYDDAEKRTFAYEGRRAAWGGGLTFGAGMISGLLGLGGSSFSVLVNELVLGLPPKVALTTSNLVVGVMALTGASFYLEAGLMDPELAAVVILGVSLGAFLGAKLLGRLTTRTVQVLSMGILILLGLQMIHRGIQWKP